MTEERDCDTCKHCILVMRDEKTGSSLYRYECDDDCDYEPNDEVSE